LHCPKKISSFTGGGSSALAFLVSSTTSTERTDNTVGGSISGGNSLGHQQEHPLLKQCENRVRKYDQFLYWYCSDYTI